MEIRFEAEGATCVACLTKEDEVTALVQVLEDIAAELCWQPGEQLRENQEAALHLAVMVNGRIAGGLQAVPGSVSNSLPCRQVWPEVEVADEAHALHVTMLALQEEHRAHAPLFWPLCVELWRWCRQQGIQSILLEATPPTLRVYQRLGWPLSIIGDLRMHWGEPCYLCKMSVDEVEGTLTEKAKRSPAYRALIDQAHRIDGCRIDGLVPVCQNGSD